MLLQLRAVLQVVAAAPGRAASYNNRAQALRLAGRPVAALQDLDRALELSGGRGRAYSDALCQRAALHRRSHRHQTTKQTTLPVL